MTQALLEIRDLHKRYGPVEVLKGVDCTMAQGEVISIIGSSGSGKTTMLRCINMLEEFQGGSIRIDGQEIGYDTVAGVRRRKREKEIARQRAMTGMAFQQFNLFPHMSAAKNVMLGLIKVRGMGRDEALSVAEKWLDRVGLLSHRDHYPGQLSGGQQQRSDRPGDCHEPEADAVRRGDLCARSGACQRGAAGDQGAGGGRDEHVARDARDAVCLRGVFPGDLHEPGAHRRRGQSAGDVPEAAD
ncbi:putative ATP-binding component of ABC transporter [Ensifer adhaerens OV14]|nr:putative ATP-binding component of ABC transporter [Ensifer adhaerens OV14]